jgi:hypothetical protein
MRVPLVLVLTAVLRVFAFSQTADELVNKNIEARGGMEKIKAINTLRISGTLTGQGGFSGRVGEERMRPNLLRQTFTLQGMTQIEAYDGTTGWAIRPFGGKKEPELMGEDDLHEFLIDTDFDGPLVDYKQKGNTVEYLGHDTVDGDDALRLKITLKSGDILYYYLDPDTYLEIREEVEAIIRGSVRETASEMGSYKAVNGVMFPYSSSSGPKDDPSSWVNITIDKVEANVPLDKSDFELPASLRKPAAAK